MDISINNLTFSYENSNKNVFENLNLSFDSDWKIGLIGRNGRGKSTLLNLLLNRYEYSGKILSPVEFDYFPYIVKDKSKCGIDIIGDIGGDIAYWEVLKKFKQLELEDDCLYQVFETLSFGQRTKLLLAILFAKENNFLLIDEPTNHLDAKSRECVKRFLSKQKGFIVVSHDRDFIDSSVDHIIAINRSGVEIQKGNFSSWWENKRDKDNAEISQNEKLKKEISRLQDSANQKKVWAERVENTKSTKNSGLRPDKGYVGHKAEKMAKRGKVIEERRQKAIDEKKKLLKNIDKEDDLFLNEKTQKAETLLTVYDLSIAYGNKEIFKKLSFTVESGEKVAIRGANGCGKSSLLKLICGEEIAHSGKIYLKSRCKISYISQSYDHLEGSLVDYAKENKIDQTRFFTLLYKMGFEREEFDKDINSYSAGQKKKVMIARSLCEECDLYVWDEPLNYIDVISRIQIEEMLKSSKITLLFVEHDTAFIKNLADKIIEL